MRQGTGWDRRVLISVLVIAAIAACATKAPRQTQLMRSTEMTISAAALRVQVRSLASRFSGLMEEAGEEALQNESDPVRRRNALLWLTNGIPAMQQALFQPDPLAALLDAWFLIAQMRRYFATAADRGMAAESIKIATRIFDAMESDIKHILDNAGPNTDYERGREFIYEHAESTPIDESFASRRGSAVFLAEFTAQAGGSALRSIGSVTETVEDLVARIDVNAEYVPKLARWQAMLLIIDQDYDNIGPALDDLAYLELVASEVDRLTPLVEALPELIVEERIAVLKALDAYLSRTLTFVDQQRSILMTSDVRAEREAVLSAIREERIAVLAAIAEERSIVLEALRRERVATFEDLDQLIDQAFSREVDRLFTRGLILIAIILGGFAAITFLGVRALKQRTD